MQFNSCPKITISCHPRSRKNKIIWQPLKGTISKRSFSNNQKCKVHSTADHDGPKGCRALSQPFHSFFYPRCQIGVVGQNQALVDLKPGKIPATYRTGGWFGPQGRSGGLQKISNPPGFETQTMQSRVSLQNM